MTKKIKNKPSEFNIKTNNIIKDDIYMNRNQLGANPDRGVAIKSLTKVILSDKEKVKSGNYEWITITPKIGKSYKVLKKKI